MKYWVYKESRILGPFDKEAVSGLPGLDAGTLVCTGDPSGGNAWVPAAELDGFSGLAAAPIYDDVPSSSSLLDQLQIESAGLLGDDEFPASFSENLFQDAGFKKDFSDILNDHISPDERHARQSREKIIELTNKLESLFRQVADLESGKSELERKLAARDFEVRTAPAAGLPAADLPAAAAPAPVEGKTFLSPAPPPIPGGPPPIAAVPQAAPAPSEWPQEPVPETNFPSFSAPKESPVAPAFAPPPDMPAMPSFAAAPEPAAPPVADTPAAEPRPSSFSKPKSFKIVPTVKSFKVLGAADAAPAAANPVPEFKFEEAPAAEAAALPPPPALVPPPAPAPAPFEPISLAPVVPPPPPEPAPMPVLAPAPVPAPVPVPVPEPAPVPNPFSFPPPEPVAAVPTPAPPPPNTLSRAMPVPDLSSDSATMQAPPMTMARMVSAGTAAETDSGTDDSAAARFAKPEPAPATGEIKKPPRNNKPFLIGGGILLVLLIVLGVIFMRQPKDDLKQMTTLDDGKAPIGVSVDDTAPAPIVKPKLSEAPPEPAPPPVPAGPSAEHAAAIEMVKDFPLDGERGTVGRWLQYSYTASPDAGTEEWNASTTGEDTVLVEYRLVPPAAGGKSALYLFEVDGNGIVAGKNLEARQMLAGTPPPDAPKPKKKPVKKAVKRRPVIEEPKEVPLMPLPDSGELRPPSEDDGQFGSDTVNQGI